mmetsp:Transcript_24952/g.35565  ORF Transcript_24952/g.35565 Transcript_24952/m.35565 type:complete len:119 (-) Transcript_24952:224-580(-)
MFISCHVISLAHYGQPPKQNKTLRLEQGDFKLRVRSSEVERMGKRASLVLKNVFAMTASNLFLGAGAMLLRAEQSFRLAKHLSRASFGIALLLLVRVGYGLMQVNSLDKYNERFVTKK